MTKIRILISIAMLLFGFNASSSDAIVYGDVAIAYGTIDLTAGEYYSTGLETFPIVFDGVPVVTLTGVGGDCVDAITVTSVTSTNVQFRTPAYANLSCPRANYIAIGKI